MSYTLSFCVFMRACAIICIFPSFVCHSIYYINALYCFLCNLQHLLHTIGYQLLTFNCYHCNCGCKLIVKLRFRYHYCSICLLILVSICTCHNAVAITPFDAHGAMFLLQLQSKIKIIREGERGGSGKHLYTKTFLEKDK